MIENFNVVICILMNAWVISNCSNVELSNGYSPFLSFNVKDMDGTVLRLLSMGAELDGPIKHPPQGKVL